MSMVTIVDTLRDLIEPDVRYQDRSLDRPQSADIRPDVWYVWPASEAFEDDGQGQIDREVFQLGVLWGSDRGAEVGGEPSRDLSEALIAKVEMLRTTLSGNRAVNDDAGDPVWEWIELIEVDYERLRTNVVRGFLARVDGWRYRTS